MPESRAEIIGAFIKALADGGSLNSIITRATVIIELAKAEEKERTAAGAIGVGLILTKYDLFPKDYPCQPTK